MKTAFQSPYCSNILTRRTKKRQNLSQPCGHENAHHCNRFTVVKLLQQILYYFIKISVPEGLASILVLASQTVRKPRKDFLRGVRALFWGAILLWPPGPPPHPFQGRFSVIYYAFLHQEGGKHRKRRKGEVLRHQSVV